MLSFILNAGEFCKPKFDAFFASPVGGDAGQSGGLCHKPAALRFAFFT
jgi:hypothetical protein